jgi:hypothetical protein
MALRVSEAITVVYVLYLAGCAWFRPMSPGRRRSVLVAVVFLAAVILVFARGGRDGPFLALRDWAPVGFLLFGYWLPAVLVTHIHHVFERVLVASDDRLFGRQGLGAFRARAPRWILELLELAYLLCYPLVPAGFAVLYFAGFRDQADRFWTCVLLAAFLCYGVLPWLPTRPPRVLEVEADRRRSRVRALNLRVLGRASIQLNTFPSGHAATALATALAVAEHLPVAGVVISIVVCGIVVGSVVGRYHYAADAAAGALMALLAWRLSQLV